MLLFEILLQKHLAVLKSIKITIRAIRRSGVIEFTQLGNCSAARVSRIVWPKNRVTGQQLRWLHCKLNWAGGLGGSWNSWWLVTNSSFLLIPFSAVCFFHFTLNVNQINLLDDFIIVCCLIHDLFVTSFVVDEWWGVYYCIRFVGNNFTFYSVVIIYYFSLLYYVLSRLPQPN